MLMDHPHRFLSGPICGAVAAVAFKPSADAAADEAVAAAARLRAS